MERLHPRLAALLRDQGWTGLTPAQQAALDPLLRGQHALLVAPTGHGKTEAALIPTLSRLLTERDHLAATGKAWPTGFKVLYVTPLRALNRDLMERLARWGEALGLRIGVRHGDTSQSERTRQARDPPDLLITTPETLQLLLYGDKLRRHLRTVRFVIADEVHELASSERGAQLLVALERVEEVVGQPEEVADTPAASRRGPTKPAARPGGGFQRIGLSATVADPSMVAEWLVGPTRTAVPIVIEARKRIELTVEAALPVEADQDLAAELSLTPAVVAQLRAVRRNVEAHRRVLIFHNTRDGAELLASRSALLDERGGGQVLLGLHHGSLSAEHRLDVERRFKGGELRGLVCTSSLELGIDVGAIDHVIQVGSPRAVARFLQRLGRSGHTLEGTAKGTLLASGAEDAMECMAVARKAAAGDLEPLRIRREPLIVLANQLAALSNEYSGLDREWCRALIHRTGAFSNLDDGLFDAAWDALLQLKTLYPDDDDPGRIGRSGRGRRHFLDHISLIADDKAYAVIDESTKRRIGTVDDGYVAAAMPPGALVVMGGRSWQVLEIEAEEARVRVAPARDLGAVPQWLGSDLPVSFELAQEVARLRGTLASSGASAVHVAAPAALELAKEPIAKHAAAGLAVPTATVVTLEVGRKTIIANVALGTRGNEALGRITQALWHQKLGEPVGMECDAYRIHFTLPGQRAAAELEALWRALKPEGLDLLAALTVREGPLLRRNLVHVAKQFGGLPKELEPRLATRAKIDALLQMPALEEEATSRLLWERLDLDAVAVFLRGVQAGTIKFVGQAIGPLSLLGVEETRRMLAPPKTTEAILAAVRSRIEDADVLMACTACGAHWASTVRMLPKRIACRRCSGTQVACLRPWNEDKVPLLRRDAKRLTSQDKLERERMVRNGGLVASFGGAACKALVARGIGPDTAARILQKVTDPADPRFWREVLLAELNFARTNAFWRR